MRSQSLALSGLLLLQGHLFHLAHAVPAIKIPRDMGFELKEGNDGSSPYLWMGDPNMPVCRIDIDWWGASFTHGKSYITGGFIGWRDRISATVWQKIGENFDIENPLNEMPPERMQNPNTDTQLPESDETGVEGWIRQSSADDEQNAKVDCDGHSNNQCWTNMGADRPTLRMSPQHQFSDKGRHYIQFYYGEADAVQVAWHTDDNGNLDDMYLAPDKIPFCRVQSIDHLDGELQTRGIEFNDLKYDSAVQYYINCLFPCPNKVAPPPPA